MSTNRKRIQYACYATNISMAVVVVLSPILFLTFHNLYGISYSLLGLLVLVNFVTQLSIDLLFSFFSHRFPIALTIKVTPLLTIFGFTVYALVPFFFPSHAYLGLVLGTILFAVSSGFSEVLISPLIEALGGDNPDREMSKLHSVYAWGVVLVLSISTLYFLIIGRTHWYWLALLFTIIPLVAFLLFFGTRLPQLQSQERTSNTLSQMKNPMVWLCVAGIFFGGAAENTMSQWCSAYLEQALGIPKMWGDLFGLALFALMLGFGRSLYAKKGRKIEKTLLWGSIGATLCYLIAALSPFPLFGLLACAFTGFCVSMLWPGSLIVASKRIRGAGVFLYAILAAGGDFGSSVGPQFVGIITDTVGRSSFALRLGEKLSMTAEQVAMRAGILVGMFLSLMAVVIFAILLHKKENTHE